MKVLFLTPWYPDNHNPHQSNFVRSQVEALNIHHEIEVISSKIDYTSFSLFSFHISKNLFKDFVEHRIIIKKSLPLINQLVYYLITVQKTIKIARKFQPDIIHGNIGYPGAFWAWVVGKLLRKPVVVTEHTRIINNFRSHIHRYLTIFPLKRVPKVIAVSQWHANEISSILKRDVNVIGNVIDIERFPIVDNRATQPPIHIGFLGFLNTSVKGLDILLESLTSIKRDYILHIGGGGKLLNDLKMLTLRLGIDCNCIFYGAITPQEVPKFMSRLHFFVSASRWETFGIAIVEALVCGLPVIVTNSCGAADFISQANGIIVQCESAEELKHAIEIMMNSVGNYNPESIREHAIKNNSVEKFVQDVSRIYESVRINC